MWEAIWHCRVGGFLSPVSLLMPNEALFLPVSSTRACVATISVGESIACCCTPFIYTDRAGHVISLQALF